MKKIIILLLSIMMLFALTVPAAAEGSASLSISNAPDVAKLGDDFSVTINAACDTPVKSMALRISYDTDAFELVSGEWLISGFITDFNGVDGVLAYMTATELSAQPIFKLSLKVKDGSAAIGPASISVQLIVKDTIGDEICRKSTSANVTVACATHNFSAWNRVSEPTCTVNGKEERSCSVCGLKEENPIAALGHDKVNHEGKAATCLEGGWEAYETCNRCDLNTYKAIDALGHDVINHEAQEVSCTEIGWNAYETCSRCDYTTYAEIAALGHAVVNHDAKEVTCLEIGWNAYETCERCDYTTYAEIAALGHQFSGWKTIEAATCTEEGKAERSCARCELVESKTVAKAAHDFESPVVVKEATLFSNGLMEGKCKNCSKTTQQVLPCSYTDKTTGIQIIAQEGVFAEGSVVEIKVENPEDLKAAMAEVSGSYKAYTIGFAANGAAVAPNGTYTVLIPVDGSVAEANLGAYILDENGMPVAAEFQIEEGYISVEADKAGTFVVADTSVPGAVIEPDVTEPIEETEPTEPATEPATEPTQDTTAPSSAQSGTDAGEEDNGGWLPKIIVILAIILVVAIVVCVLKRKI